jgi:transcription-repair coupling factor (superfamily II helicase)
VVKSESFSDICAKISDSKFFANIAKQVSANSDRIKVKTLKGSLKSAFVASLYSKLNKSILLLSPNNDEIDEYQSDFSILKSISTIALKDEEKSKLKASVNDNSDELRLLDSLSKIQASPQFIALATPNILDKKLPTANNISSSKMKVRVGDEIDYENFRRELIFKGFEKCDYVTQHGEIAVRGGIIDIFPAGRDNPIRIECWGDEIESIREFDILSQRSSAKFDEIEFVSDMLAKAQDEDYSTILDYLPENCVLIIDTPQIMGDEENVFIEPNFAKKIILNAFEDADFEIKSTDQISINASMKKLAYEIRRLSALQYSIYLAADGAIHSQRFKDILENSISAEDEELTETSEVLADPESSFNNVHWLSATPHKGFISEDLKMALFTEHQVFNRLKIKNISKQEAKKGGISLKELKQLKPGDYVVHADKGIGVFVGFETVNIGGSEQDCVKLHYEGGDSLYVHLNYIHKIQKYSSQEGVAPKLSKLGSTEWERKKNKAKKKLKDIARDLIKLYAKRKAAQGYSFPSDTVWQKEFEASFMFEDTPDQRRSTDEVKRDMENLAPMDRLVCGDVGFGKTEIAIRAAFKAAQAGKQCAILAPTTILAQQHFESFKDRMSGYPVNVNVISRFRSKKEQDIIIENLEKGKIDILIGTHRLLSKDIKFKDLGLLIIDEEHRFGVSAKEKLRELKANIDTLTLTATPIPRTLNFSLMGARDLSLIETPPRNRRPVKTRIIEWNEGEIRTAIAREIERKGQIYVVHDKVKDIEKLADSIRKLAPTANIGIVHGQMTATMLEKEMQRFIERKTDILIATKIVESGLDIPNANTIIINRAQNFGLAELYQLRGRVGRSNVQAYCYLAVPSFRILANNILRRLQAIEEFTDLGSGFKLAMRDMEIRGAGNLLGGEQSGFIADIGFDLFHKILDEAVQELRYEEFGDIFDDKYKKKPIGISNEEMAIELNADALIPADYISADTERYQYYKNLYDSKSNEELKKISEEMEDRFGKMPKQVKELLFVVKLRIAALNTGFQKIIVKRGFFIAEFPPEEAKEFYEVAFPDISEYLQELDGARLYQDKSKLYFRMEYESRNEIVEIFWRIRKTVESILEL